MAFKTIIPITKAHLTSKINRPGQKLIKPLKIAIHYTGNSNKGANAMANRNYFNSTDRYASAQYNVDDKQIIECMPWWEVAWAVGGSSYTKFGNSLRLNGNTPNYSTISIEMCVNSDSSYKSVVENTVSLTVWLLLETGLTPKDICRHYDITGKQCPYFYLDDKDWNEFLSYVQDIYDDNKYNRPVQIDYKKVNTVEILVDDLNIRKGPTTKYESIGRYNKGERVVTYEQVEGWYRSDIGWFSGDKTYCKIVEPMKPSEEPSIMLKNAFGKVTADILNIREKPDTYSNIVGKYYKDQQIELLEERNKWYRTDKGWVFAEYIKRIDYREIVQFDYDTPIVDENGNRIGIIPKGKNALLFHGYKTIGSHKYVQVKYDSIMGFVNPYIFKVIK